MSTSPITRISLWGLGIACSVGLAACGVAEPPAAAPTSRPAAQAAPSAAESPTAPATAIPIAAPPTAAPATPTIILTAPALPTTAPKETSMSNDNPTQPPTRPTLRVETTLVPEGAAAPTAPSGTAPTAASASQAPVDIAKADLARRRTVAPDTIRVIETRSVTWPDPSLGCPQPGMAYRQVPVDGLLIRLESGGQIFEYHSGGSKAPFLCEKPASGGKATPVSGGEGR